jgi:hypothetical protein
MMRRPPSVHQEGVGEFISRFGDFELKNDLFDTMIQQYPIWQAMRFRIARKIAAVQGLEGIAHDVSPPTGLLHNLARLLRLPFWYLVDNPFKISTKELVVLGHPRRKLEQDGLWWDLYCDPVLEKLDMEWAYIDRTHSGVIRRPAKTSSIYSMRLPELMEAIQNRLGITRSLDLGGDENRLLKEIEGDLDAEFGVKTGFAEAAKYRLLRRRFFVPVYLKILRKAKPRLAVVVVSYFTQDFIEACKILGIPVVEFQHGFMGPDHLGYSYPKEVHRKVTGLFPDWFFSFGDYWSRLVDFPISEERIIPIGYPYFDRNRERFAHLPKKRQVLFLSQGIIGRELSQIASRFAQEKSNHGFDVVYKLHPGEYGRWSSEYEWLRDAPLTVISGDTPHLYELFARSAMQVGYSSTAIFEGLGFGLQTMLYRSNDHQASANLVEEGMAIPFMTADELIDLAKKPSRQQYKEGPTSNPFFQKSDEHYIAKLLEKISIARE